MSPRPASGTRPPRTFISVPVSTEQHHDWKRRADKDGRKLGAWVRRQVELHLEAQATKAEEAAQ
jgi:hypothetical protein